MDTTTAIGLTKRLDSSSLRDSETDGGVIVEQIATIKPNEQAAATIQIDMRQEKKSAQDDIVGVNLDDSITIEIDAQQRQRLQREREAKKSAENTD